MMKFEKELFWLKIAFSIGAASFFLTTISYARSSPQDSLRVPIGQGRTYDRAREIEKQWLEDWIIEPSKWHNPGIDNLFRHILMKRRPPKNWHRFQVVPYDKTDWEDALSHISDIGNIWNDTHSTHFSFKKDLEGAEVLLVGSGPVYLHAFLEKYPKVAVIHLIDIDPYAFRAMEAKLQHMHRQTSQSLPRLYGYGVDAFHDMPEELAGRIDMAADFALLDPLRVDKQLFRSYALQILKVLKPGGVHFSWPIFQADFSNDEEPHVQHYGRIDYRLVMYPDREEVMLLDLGSKDLNRRHAAIIKPHKPIKTPPNLTTVPAHPVSEKLGDMTRKSI